MSGLRTPCGWRMRDPRTDPQPGDVLDVVGFAPPESMDMYETQRRTVVSRAPDFLGGPRVEWSYTRLDYLKRERTMSSSCDIDAWRKDVAEATVKLRA